MHQLKKLIRLFSTRANRGVRKSEVVPETIEESYVPEKRTGDWGMILRALRRSVSPIVATSQSSINILPLSSSTIRNKALSMLDFPAPVLPTMPTF